MVKPIGIDISRWQHPVNWVNMEKAKPAFLVHRATIARDYIDPFFFSSTVECQNRRIPFSAYHVVRCDYKAQDQITNFISALKLAGAEKTSLPLVLDCELDNGKSQAEIAQIIYDCLRILEDYNGKQPIIYSRKSWVEVHVGYKNWLNEYDWWLAMYPNSDSLIGYDKTPEPPAPVDLERVKLHQFTANGNGKTYGSNSLSIDQNWWQGDQSNLDAYISTYTGIVTPPVTPPPCPDKTLNDRVALLEKQARDHGWNV